VPKWLLFAIFHENNCEKTCVIQIFFVPLQHEKMKNEEQENEE